MRVYLSARFERQAEIRRYAAEARRAGLDVISGWLTATSDGPADWPRAAADDLVDLTRADVLIAFTEATAHPRGGRHVEFGIALGLSLGMRPGAAVRVIVVGPIENAFHTLPGVERVPTWRAALASLTGIVAEGEPLQRRAGA